MNTLKVNAYKFLILILFSLVFYIPLIAQQENQSKTYIQIRVDGLSCPFCAYGLEKKLKKIDGVANIHIALEEGVVEMNVPTKKKPSEDDINKVVTDAGFTPREIKFSETPFKADNDNP